MTPGVYILREKIDAARHRLGNPKKNITTIAFELGFPSSQYFATVFKQFTGRSPSYFREKQLRLLKKGKVEKRSPAPARS